MAGDDPAAWRRLRADPGRPDRPEPVQPGYLDNDDPTWAQAWRQERQATLIPGLGISANHLGFVAGFMIMTIAAPIAVVEAFVSDRADRPWLGGPA